MSTLGQRASILSVVLGLIACDAPAEPTTATMTIATMVTTTTTAPATTTVPESSEGDEADPQPVRRRPAELPTPRTEVTGTVWEGRIVAVGGLDLDRSALALVDVYDPGTDTWSRAPDVPVALHHTAVAVLGDRVYVVGGYADESGSWVPVAEVWSLGSGEDEWREEPSLATARGALAVASAGDRLVAVGGVGRGGVVLTSTEIFDPDLGVWEPGPDLEEPREHLAATAVGDEVYAIAGRAGGMATNLASVEVLTDDAWQQAPNLQHPRGGIGAATVKGIPCVVGGEEQQGTIASIECLVSGSWVVVDELDVARHGLAVAASGGALHVIGGGPEPGLTVSGVHEVIAIP